MAQIPLTGPFSMADINAEWVLGNNLGAYRGARTDIGFLPNTPLPLSYSDFRGRRKAFVLDIIISSPTPNVNLRSLAVAYGWDQVVPLTMTVRNRSVVYATSTSIYALDTDQDFPSGSVLNWYNNDLGADSVGTNTGIIAGRGGDGGLGGNGVIYGGFGNHGSDGSPGGPAMLARWPINIWNYGVIGGGGGGGGGNGSSMSIFGSWVWGTNQSGGGGGGGGGYGPGAPPNFSGTGGGGPYNSIPGGAGAGGGAYFGGAGGASAASFIGGSIFAGNGGSLGQSGGNGGTVFDTGYTGSGDPGGTPGYGGYGGSGGRGIVGGGAILQYAGLIFSANPAPYFTNGAYFGGFDNGTAVTVGLNAFDPEGEAMGLFYGDGGLPAGLSVVNTSPGNAIITGTLSEPLDRNIVKWFNIYVYDASGATRVRLHGMNINYVVPPDPGSGGGGGGGPSLSCFPADALVTMADYSTKPISAIQPGDILVGGRGELNEVIALDITKLGNRPLWVINNDHRTTAEHRHLTTEGWASLEPSSTWAEHEVEFPVIYKDGIRNRKMLKFVNGTPLHKLEIGMTFDTLDGSVPFYSLNSEQHDPDTNVYSLVMSGSHTFIVNGYTVSGWATDADFDYETWTPRGNTNA